MDLTVIQPFNLPYSLVDKEADAQVEALLKQIKADLEAITQHIDGSSDSPLTNCWDEICVQQQDEEFYSWHVYEQTIERVIDGCFNALSRQQQLYVNFAAVELAPNIDEPEYDSIYEEGILEYLYKEILELALNDTNPRIEKYLYGESDDDEGEPHDPNEYLLLRIDPARRDEFLTALNLFGFVKNVAIDDEGAPYLSDLLDHVDIPEKQ